MSGQTAEGLASVLANNVIDYGDPDYHRRYAEKIESITADALVEAGRRYLDPAAADDDRARAGRPRTRRSRCPSASPRPRAVDLPREPVDLDNRGSRTASARTPRGSETRADRDRSDRDLRAAQRAARARSVARRWCPAVAVHLYHLGGLLADSPQRLGRHERRVRAAHARHREPIGRGAGAGDREPGRHHHHRLRQQLDLHAGGRPRRGPAADRRAGGRRHAASRRSRPRSGTSCGSGCWRDIDARTDHWTSEISTLFREAWFDGTLVGDQLAGPPRGGGEGHRRGAAPGLLRSPRSVDRGARGIRRRRPGQVRELATKHFGGLPQPAPRSKFAVPAFDRARRKDRHQGVEQAARGGPDRARSDADARPARLRDAPGSGRAAGRLPLRLAAAGAARPRTGAGLRGLGVPVLGARARVLRRAVEHRLRAARARRSTAPWRCSTARARRRRPRRTSSGRRRRSWPPSSSTSSR